MHHERRVNYSAGGLTIPSRPQHNVFNARANPAPNKSHRECGHWRPIRERTNNMKNTIKHVMLPTAALAAALLATAPASAARLRVMACSGDNLAKAESMVEGIPDGNPAKLSGYKEMTDANEALSSGKMSECAMHLNRAMQMGTPRPAS
jgi:hypothetical protein